MPPSTLSPAGPHAPGLNDAETQIAQRQHSRRAICTLDATPAHVPRARAFAMDTLTAWGVTGEITFTAQLIVSELVTNAVRHSGADIVRVTLDGDNAEVSITVSDTGTWHAPREDAENLPEHGRGLAMVKESSAHHHIDPSQRGTRVWAMLKM
ncbi:ATP-binding protein [Streptomyces chartreusis]